MPDCASGPEPLASLVPARVTSSQKASPGLRAKSGRCARRGASFTGPAAKPDLRDLLPRPGVEAELRVAPGEAAGVRRVGTEPLSRRGSPLRPRGLHATGPPSARGRAFPDATRSANAGDRARVAELQGPDLPLPSPPRTPRRERAARPNRAMRLPSIAPSSIPRCSSSWPRPYRVLEESRRAERSAPPPRSAIQPNPSRPSRQRA